MSPVVVGCPQLIHIQICVCVYVCMSVCRKRVDGCRPKLGRCMSAVDRQKDMNFGVNMISDVDPEWLLHALFDMTFHDIF